MKLTRSFQLELTARKEGESTFAAVLATETPVRRSGWDGSYLEVLSHAKGAVDLSRSPLPLIESHDSRTLPIGLVENVRIVDGKLRGDVTFGASQRAREVAADVAGGIIRNLSIGYTIDKAVEKTDGASRTTTVTATRWTPYEASVVAIGADAGAGFGRSTSMDPETTQNPPPEMETRADTETRGPTRGPTLIERDRVLAIQHIGRAFRRPQGEVDAAIAKGTPLDTFRAMTIDALAAADAADGGVIPFHVGPRDSPRVSAGHDASADFRAAAADALLVRAGVRLASKPHPASGDISGSVLELARTCVLRSGRSIPSTREELVTRAMTTSDFPVILANTMGVAVRNGYESEPASHRAWVRPVPVPDFRLQSRPILGSAPALAQVQESGEYTEGSMSDDTASYGIVKYGKIITLAWETLVNDNLGAFLRIQPAMGQAARRLEADTVYALLAANPVMQDTVALFHASHGNLGTSGAFDATILGAARTLLRKQTALGGGYLSLVPRYLIVPAEKEQTAETLIAAATRSVTTVDATIPQWISQLELVVEPRLAATAIYLAADSAQIDTCELGLLDENIGGPKVSEDRSEEFRRDVYAWKVRHVFGAKFLDWRGIVKQPVT